MAGVNAGAEGRNGRLLSTMLDVFVASVSDQSRLGRGRTYARQGAVQDLDVQSGVLHATVQGTRPRPYDVTITVDPGAGAGSASQLVPNRRDVRFTCSCPDWDDPCKHAVAVMLQFSQLVADEPGALRTWRGAGEALSTDRAVVGSRSAGTTLAMQPQGDVASDFDDEAVAALATFLGTPRPFDLAPISRLAPPAAAWGDLWAEMLTDALRQLTDDE